MSREAFLQVRIVAVSVDRQDAAAILGPRLFGRTEDRRALLAVAERAQPRAVDALSRQIVADRVGTALAEGEVVLAGAALVGVALDRRRDVRVLAQPAGPALDLVAALGIEVVTVVLEEDAVADGLRQFLLGARTILADGGGYVAAGLGLRAGRRLRRCACRVGLRRGAAGGPIGSASCREECAVRVVLGGRGVLKK